MMKHNEMTNNILNNQFNKTAEQSEPQFLYKYKALNSETENHAKEILVSNKLYFPSPAHFNDPFDCRLHMSLKGNLNEWKHFIVRMVKNRHPEFNRVQMKANVKQILKEGKYKDSGTRERIAEHLQDAIDRVGVFCLSEKADQILM